ncbi:phosphoglycerate mutase family protein [Bacteroides sp. 214]|uniref:phosphoglycerate mutase family protein n=1 Tax=Bacteroides sp. 214 TaxID=2302935 RepID=UPI0013D19D21|nr:phosphoglycerate mutase family protein [Bacteroides sp. 214]NDW13479.1 phosphoglycerate mutase family protein [Bacteroides sp. 214]
MDILKYSQEIQKTAFEILENSKLIQLWEAIGAEVYMVGSAKTGLLIHKDIDIHVYTEKVSVSDSFSVMAKLAERMNLTEIQYKNGLETEEECIEWHALFEDKNKDCWKLDLIHIRKGSMYDGVVEKVTDTIAGKLTPELRKTILQIKYDMPKNALIPGIEVYHAVFTGNVKTYEELLQWRKTNPLTNSLGWMP